MYGLYFNPARGLIREVSTGIDVSDSTVRRYRPPRVSPHSQNWRSFLKNHLADFAAEAEMDSAPRRA